MGLQLDKVKIQARIEELNNQIDAFGYNRTDVAGLSEDECLDRIFEVGLDSFEDEILMGIASELNNLDELLKYAA